MTELLHWILSNWFTVLTTLILIETSAKSAAEKRGNLKIVNLCDHIGDVLGFVYDTVTILIKKTPVTKLAILGFLLLCSYGCAPISLYKGGCGNLASTKNTIPYTFGTLDAGGDGCYLLYSGKGTPNFDPIKALMTSYITTAKPNTLITSDGSTVMVIPPTKK